MKEINIASRLAIAFAICAIAVMAAVVLVVRLGNYTAPALIVSGALFLCGCGLLWDAFRGVDRVTSNISFVYTNEKVRLIIPVIAGFVLFILLPYFVVTFSVIAYVLYLMYLFIIGWVSIGKGARVLLCVALVLFNLSFHVGAFALPGMHSSLGAQCACDGLRASSGLLWYGQDYCIGYMECYDMVVHVPSDEIWVDD